MNRLVLRRCINISALTALAVVLVIGDRIYVLTLSDASFLSGWVLFSMLMLLTLFGLRKKLPMLRLGRASTWTQFHIYLGLLAVLTFVMHLGWRVPAGWFERMQALLFVAVAASGILGIIISRWVPRRLALHREDAIYERIPQLIDRCRGEAESLVRESLRQTGSDTIADFYRRNLITYFSGPRDLWRHMINSSHPRHRVISRIEEQQRYLNEKERGILAAIRELVLQKLELDNKYAGYSMLKGWLFIHIPLTYGLLLLVVLHVTIVYAFAGGS